MCSMYNTFICPQIPLLVSEISTVDHPVTVGLADSFYVDVPLRGDGKHDDMMVVMVVMVVMM